MGKQFWAGVFLLTALLAGTLGIGLEMEWIYTPAQTQLTQASQLALAGQEQQAQLLAQQAKSRWERFRKISAVVADHTPMDEIDKLFEEMRIYAQEQETPHFAASCAQLARLLQGMADAHSPTWWNLM